MIYLPRVTHTAKGGQVDDLVTQSHTYSKRGSLFFFYSTCFITSFLIENMQLVITVYAQTVTTIKET